MNGMIDVTGWDLADVLMGAWAVSRPAGPAGSIQEKRPSTQLTLDQVKDLLLRFKDDRHLVLHVDDLMHRSVRLKVTRTRDSRWEMANQWEPAELADLLKFCGKAPPVLRESTIERNYIDSSTLNSIGYDMATGTLAIQFTNGTVYEYSGFGGHEWEQFAAADSQGKHFGALIRGKYLTTRMADAPLVAKSEVE
jgi:hypothetical protein